MARPLIGLPRRRSTDRAAAAERTGTDGSDGSGRSAAAVVAVRRLFAAETGTFWLLLGTTLFLVVLGLVMVLSSSSVEEYLANDSFFGAFGRQATFAAIGVPAMLVASRFPVSFWKRWAVPLLLFAVVFQALVFTPLGYEVGGNRNWIRVGGLTAQPSELVKLALAVWLGTTLALKRDVLDDWRELLRALVPAVAVSIGLVVAGGDLGTTMIMVLLVFAAVWFAGVKIRYLLVPLAVLAVAVPIVTQLSSSRTDRISAWLSGCTDEADYQADCWQTLHGTWALASGGLFGVGLGNSKSKWSWLPEADNDFIFAIIGEELGLVGAVVVLALFIVLAVCFVRIVRRSRDPFVRVVTGAVMAWIVGQALVNIAVVLGLLPVLGVPLPLISAGGSALIVTLAAIGVVLSFARHADDEGDEPEPVRAPSRAAARPRPDLRPVPPASGPAADSRAESQRRAQAAREAAARAAEARARRVGSGR